MQLTKADFDALSKTEQDLALSLGLTFDLSKVTRKRNPQCTSGSPYILITNITCKLCSSTVTKIFKMTQEKNFLYSEEIGKLPSEEEMKFMKLKTSHYVVRNCQGCYKYLQNLTKSELVQRFLVYIQDVRHFIK